MAYLIFDLPHENDSKGIHIPAASLKLSKLDNARKLFLCVEAGSSVLLPEDISPSEMLRTHQMLTALNAVLLNELAKASIAGKCPKPRASRPAARWEMNVMAVIGKRNAGTAYRLCPACWPKPVSTRMTPTIFAAKPEMVKSFSRPPRRQRPIRSCPP